MVIAGLDLLWKRNYDTNIKSEKWKGERVEKYWS